jgi:hypothetical protein
MSPRGDWRMPSDAKVTAWLADPEQVPFLLVKQIASFSTDEAICFNLWF